MRLGVLGIILAGGKGTRLFPLTKERAKPAVPFGGKYRIVDFVLSNFINPGIHSIYVLTQFKSQSLLQHLSDGWQFGGLLKEQFIIPVPAQMRSAGETWYRGTADAIYQNANLIEQSDPHLVAIFPSVASVRDVEPGAFTAFFSGLWASRFEQYDASYLRSHDAVGRDIRQAVWALFEEVTSEVA